MFSYFGNKGALLNLYKPPVHDLIFEPFAGSARYACKYGLERDVWLNDKYKVIADIWKWIVNATLSDVKALPTLTKKGQTLDDYKQLSEVERNLLGFATGVSRAQPVSRISSFGAARQGTADLKMQLKLIVGKISHWKVTNLSYDKLPNKVATWYIDPPYQHYGKHYKEKKINFKKLGKWCFERQGQVIVCEAYPADWMDKYGGFKPLKGGISRVNRDGHYQEVVWYRSDKKVGLIY
jgi:site-specific DNA-adenine methylase